MFQNYMKHDTKIKLDKYIQKLVLMISKMMI